MVINKRKRNTIFGPRKKRALTTSDNLVSYMRTSGLYSPRIQEMKWFDVSGSTNMGATGSIIESFNKVVQGTGESQRIGRKLNILSMYFKFQILLPNSTDPTLSECNYRIVIYQDKQANGASATTTSLYTNPSIVAFRNLSENNRFNILYDKRGHLNSTAGSYNGTTNVFAAQSISTKFYKKSSIPIEFNSTTGAMTEIRSNNIGIVCFSEAGLCNLSYISRIRYTD